MIVNLWSTPRTGSVWYSMYLTSIYRDSVLVSEMFNRYMMNVYHVDEAGSRVNIHQYEAGCYYEEFVVIGGKITREKTYSARTRDIIQEEEYRVSLLDQLDSKYTHIFHNHVEPINPEIKQRLLNIGKNIYIYRRDRRAQLGSYAIAAATKKFINFIPVEDTEIITETSMESVEGLINRIRIWDDMNKDGEIIAYEDIDFKDRMIWPKKQVADYRQRLSPEILSKIDQLVAEYESSSKTT